MHIDKINIENFKCFEGEFSLGLNEGVNILVGNNEAGKSTILEAIHLALSGILNGRYIKNELSQYLFNKAVEEEYIKSLKTGSPQAPPYILIELFLSGKTVRNLHDLRVVTTAKRVLAVASHSELNLTINTNRNMKNWSKWPASKPYR